MLARFLEVAGACASILFVAPNPPSAKMPKQSIDDYTTALAAFRQTFPQL